MRMRSLIACIVAVSVSACGDSSTPYVATIDLSRLIRRLDPDAPGGGDDAVDADEAVERLTALGDGAVPTLETALAKEGKPIRLGIVEVLSGIETDRANDALARIARADPEPEVRASALLRLGATGGKAARPALEAGLDDPSPVVNQTAAVTCAALCTSPAAIDHMLDIALDTLPDAELARMRGSLAALLAGPDRTAAGYAHDRLVARTAAILAGTATPDARARAAIFAMLAGMPGMEPILAETVRSSSNTMLRTEALHVLQRAGATSSTAPTLRP
jgi:HEAT repeat protein